MAINVFELKVQNQKAVVDSSHFYFTKLTILCTSSYFIVSKKVKKGIRCSIAIPPSPQTIMPGFRLAFIILAPSMVGMYPVVIQLSRQPVTQISS